MRKALGRQTSCLTSGDEKCTTLSKATRGSMPPGQALAEMATRSISTAADAKWPGRRRDDCVRPGNLRTILPAKPAAPTHGHVKKGGMPKHAAQSNGS